VDEQLALAGTISQLQKEMAQGNVSAWELTAFFLARIARLDRSCGLRAVLEVNPDALQIAAGLDARRRHHGSLGPLHGIPILLKDNIATGDKMHTSAGSLALADAYAGADAALVERLRRAGAVIIGKANLTEWANFMTDHMPNGYSSRGGQTQNPYGAEFDVGGSSSGSAAAVAAGFAVAAVGTETSGSILSPASSNSVVGIKPTVGLVSRRGIVPISNSQDTAGPLARTVADAAVLLGALSGYDESDPATHSSTALVQSDYGHFLDANALVGARLGVARSPYYDHLSSERLQICDRALRAMADAGAVIVDPVEIPGARDVHGYDVLLYEFKPNLNAYLRQHGTHQIASLADVIAWNEAHAEEALRYGQTILTAAQALSGQLIESAYIEARLNDVRRSRTEGLDAAMRAHDLDALVFPANMGAGIAAKAGYPSVCTPAGYTDAGEPFGVTFTGRAYSEGRLIAIAHAFERCLTIRRAPQLGLAGE
jgi:amidase